MDFLFISFLIPILVVIGIVGLIVKFFTAPKGERLEPDSWKKFGMGFSIALIIPFMVGYGFTTFVDRPSIDYSYQSLEPQSKFNGTQNGDRLPDTYFNYERTQELTETEYQTAMIKYRAASDAAHTEYAEAKEDFHTAMFITFGALGIIAIVGGLMTSIPAASIGVLYGGILSLLFGFASYWEYMNDAAIFVALVIAFVTLVYAAYRKFYKPEDKAA